jgi:hypothetical protein
MNPNWLLPEHADPSSVLACRDPAEALARLARVHGCMALDLTVMKRPDDAPTQEVFALMVEHAAVVAWRFAAAAVLLYRHQELNRVVAAGAPEEPDDEPGEPAYMQALRELAKPWKSELT